MANTNGHRLPITTMLLPLVNNWPTNQTWLMAFEFVWTEVIIRSHRTRANLRRNSLWGLVQPLIYQCGVEKNTQAEPTDSDHDWFFQRMIVITWQCGIVGVKSDQYRWAGWPIVAKWPLIAADYTTTDTNWPYLRELLHTRPYLENCYHQVY